LAVTPTAEPAPTATYPPEPTIGPSTRPQEVARLPLDRPWIHAADSSGCDGILLANDGQGGLLRLGPPVVAVIERGGDPPLIVTCQDWRYATVDARSWATTPLDLEPGRLAVRFVLSPDGAQLAFASVPRVPPSSDRLLARVEIADTSSGQLHTLIDGDQLAANNQLNYAGYELIAPVAWSGSLLYTEVYGSAASTFWRTDVAQQPAQPQPTQVAVESGWWEMPATGDWLVWGRFDGTPQLSNLRTGAVYALDGSQARAAAISPDGTRLAFLRSGSGGSCCELVLYNLTQNPPAPLLAPLLIGEPLVVGSGSAIRWSPDSQRLLAITGSQLQGQGTLFAFGRDGAELGQASIPGWELLLEAPRPVRDNEVALVQRDEPRTVLRGISFGAANASPLPDVTLMDRLPYSMGWILAYVPVA
jgi:hypothetical protein